jgi:two-component system CheB/CheR fusion protein
MATASDYPDYLDHLQVHPDEFTALFNTILINVTAFFRDPDAWDYLRAEVLPALLAARPGRGRSGSGAPAAPPARRRTPSRSCSPRRSASNAFRERVKIYATDVDEEQLAEARQAAYTERAARRCRPSWRSVLRAGRRPVHLPQGPAPLGHLRPQRPGAGRADLPHRPAGPAATP